MRLTQSQASSERNSSCTMQDFKNQRSGSRTLGNLGRILWIAGIPARFWNFHSVRLRNRSPVACGLNPGTGAD